MLFTEFFLPPQNIILKPFSVFFYTEFYIVINIYFNNPITRWLIVCIVELFQVWVLQSLNDTNSLVRIEGQHPFKQVHGLFAALALEVTQPNLLALLHALQERLSQGGIHTVDVALGGLSHDPDNLFQLVQCGRTREYRSSDN